MAMKFHLLKVAEIIKISPKSKILKILQMTKFGFLWVKDFKSRQQSTNIFKKMSNTQMMIYSFHLTTPEINVW